MDNTQDASITHYGDLGAQEAERLRRQHREEASENPLPDVEVLRKENSKAFFSKIEFHWRPEDQKIVTQIRAAAERVFDEEFREVIKIIDGFLSSVRVPRMTRYDTVERDSRNRTVWEVDEKTGMPRVDWSRLTGQDIEETLLNLQLVKLTLSPRLSELMNEAVYAKHVYDDEWYEAYQKVLEGTTGDRQAKANVSSRVDRYHAFFRKWLWQQGDSFVKEIDSFMFLLGRVRDWRIRTQRN